MPSLDLPVNGEQPWGDKLNTAIETLNISVDDLQNALTGAGTAENPHTDPDATRNADLVKNFYQCSTEPTTWLDGDEWIQTP